LRLLSSPQVFPQKRNSGDRTGAQESTWPERREFRLDTCHPPINVAFGMTTDRTAANRHRSIVAKRKLLPGVTALRA
jgi:hypothetical protein